MLARKRVPSGVENEAKIKQTIYHAQWWRLRVSPVEHNEYLKLELQGAWEPPCKCSPLSFGEGKSFQGFVFDGDRLAMLWKEEVNLHT